ncbi:hypothetical protein D1872_305820 [compost metagenome]
MVYEYIKSVDLFHDFGCAFNTADKLCFIKVPFPWASELHVHIAGARHVPGIYEYDRNIPSA